MNKLKTLTVSIIIPCYNEKFTIEKIIRKINSIKHKFNYEVIVVDDFSTDGTRNILKKLQKSKEGYFFRQKLWIRQRFKNWFKILFNGIYFDTGCRFRV